LKKILFILLGSLFFLTAQEKTSKTPPAIKCVVTGDEIDLDESSAYKDGKVYFCCAGCKMDFEESPKKFSKAANFQLVLTNQYEQTSCPITGDSPGHDHHKAKDMRKTMVEGLSVDLCCPGCLKKVNKSKDKFSMLFSDKAFAKGFTLKSDSKSKNKM